ncbi:MAG: hypothetical protein LC775_00455 [Acidobacteria bacterium]|nr:hypothetical protein [Acidobacteriota bacterium]
MGPTAVLSCQAATLRGRLRPPLATPGEDFLYVFKPGLAARDAPPLTSGYALAPASLRERAGRLARDKLTRSWTLQWLRPGKGGAHCAEPPPQRQAPSPLRVPIHPAPPRIDCWAVIVTVASGSRPEGPGGSGVNGLT